VVCSGALPQHLQTQPSAAFLSVPAAAAQVPAADHHAATAAYAADFLWADAPAVDELWQDDTC